MHVCGALSMLPVHRGGRDALPPDRVKEREGIQNQEVQILIRTSAGTVGLGAGRFLEL
jgi:hypothetical protein